MTRYFLLFTLAFLFGCQEKINRPTEEKTPAKDRLSIKNIPNDHFYLQRSYPDGQFNLKAFEKSMNEARQMAAQRDPGFEGEWIVQGPGNIGARINSIAIHPGNEDIIIVGFSQGGAWRTIDGGQNWTSIFDDQPYPSIGDIAFDPNNPQTIYIGTGDPNISGYPWIGDGIWRSQDGGDTWEHLGLEEERIVSKIIVHPNDPNIIFASTMGLPFERNSNRGLYRSIDNGQTWQQVLFLSEDAGVNDLVMDPFDPQTLYASGWNRIRNNHESVISGPDSKFYKSTDGGNTWTLMEGGLPMDDQGRTGLAISKQTPGLLYALVVGTDSDLQGIYRTVDAGENWSPVNTDMLQGELGGFGWYFGQIRINPADDNLIYLLDVELWSGFVFDDMAVWNTVGPPWWEYSVHADKHDLVFENGNMYLATDGGLYRSTDSGNNWVDIENIPTTQFYRIAYNPHQPEWYYGGAQDNGTTGGNADNINGWPRIYGGDGFLPIFHPLNPNVFFVETQNGQITMTDDNGFNFFPADDGIDGGDRRNWDMPYILSVHDPNVMYAGTFRVYKSTSPFPFYSPISEDLTDGLILNPRYHTITTIAESPIEQGLLYIGTVDANVWRTEDDGGEWTDITSDLPNQYVTEVKASPTHEDWVYVTHSGYKENEFFPHIHISKDRGATWEDISSNLPNLAINDVFILPNHEDTVLFVATDAGVYGSLNSGENWNRLGVNMPFVPSYDLEWNPSENTLMAGTHARSILTYPIDSLLFMEMEPVDTTTALLENYAGKAPLKIYPNPATDFVKVEAPEQGLGIGELSVLNVNGIVVKKQSWGGQKSSPIQIHDLPAGTYLLNLKVEELIWQARFIKN